ncbi:MAG TPA: TonB-dependent receptor [Steroidobacteraceae bacterium]|nr:TonB-dependent receptor [Steroidobacteraceae bacterium]
MDDPPHTIPSPVPPRARGQSPGLWAALLALLSILLSGAAGAAKPGPSGSGLPEETHPPTALRHYQLKAGDASLMLNEFSRQSDLQVLFDFNILRGMRTQAVEGDLKAEVALKRMLKGTHLMFDFVNDRTLAVTPKKQSFLARLWHRLKNKPHGHAGSDDDLEEVLISGVQQGVAPALGAQHLALERSSLEESGAATVSDYLRTFPQIFGGGPTQDTQRGPEALSNAMHGYGINLRGLDAGATVALINGQRVAPSGTSAAWVDVSQIPISAIQRIDLLPDGAGAQYGSDAIGGVVNFQLRSNFVGAETQVRAGGVTDGPTKEQQISHLLGHTWEDGHGIAAVEYYHRDALPASSRPEATSDLRAFGGTNYDLLNSNPGTLFTGGQYYAIPHGQDGTALNPSSLAPGTQNTSDRWQGATILPQERRISALTSLRQAVDDHYTVFLDALAADRTVNARAAGYAPVLTVTAANPFYVNPTGATTPVSVLYDFGRDFGSLTTDADDKTGNVMAGVEWEGPEGGQQGWKIRGSVGYSFEHETQTIDGYADPKNLAAALADPDPSTAFNPFGDGSFTDPATLASIRTQTHYRGDSNLKLLQLHAGGPILPLPGGAVKVALGFDYRDQVFDSVVVPVDPSQALRNDLGRHVVAGFAELRVPVFGADNPLPGFERLEFSAALRREQYSDVGGATTPQFGFSWAPAEPITLRGTWSKAFRAPNLPDRVENTNTSGLITLPDPTASNQRTQALVWVGNNANLQAERGRSWTVGADFKSDAVPGLSFGVTYFDTHLIDRVETTPFSLDALEDPLYAALVTRNPTSAERASVCSRSSFQGVTVACLSAPIGAIVDLRLRNAATVITRGFDVNAEYRVPQAPGQLTLGLLATDLLEFSRADLAGGPLQHLLNTENQPVDLRFRASAAWDYHRFGVVGFVNYTDAYRQFITDSTRIIPSWTTLDVRLSYELGDTAGGGSGTQFALNVENLFNRAPPFVNNPIGIGYDQENGDLLGRLVSFNVKYRW